MVSNVMSELLHKDSPEPVSIVDRFLMILDSLLHFFHSLFGGQSLQGILHAVDAC